jgi:hypothetical protein
MALRHKSLGLGYPFGTVSNVVGLEARDGLLVRQGCNLLLLYLIICEFLLILFPRRSRCAGCILLAKKHIAEGAWTYAW